MAETKSSVDIASPKPPRAFFRILLVDDEPVARHLLRAILLKEGFSNLIESTRGDDALEKLRQEEIHLVLLDKNLPGLDGLEVLREGRKLRPACEFIVITAYGSMESAIRAMDLGAFSYVTKPFSDLAVIASRVEAAMERVGLRLENSWMIERLHALAVELERVQGEVADLKSLTDGSQKQAHHSANRLREAAGRLGSLASQLETLGSRAQGRAANWLDRVVRQVHDVAELLEPASTDPPSTDPPEDKDR